MHKLYLPALLMLLSLGKITAQAAHFEVNMAHNWNHLDRDLELSAERFFRQNGFRFGLHYFQNTAEETLNWQDKPRATNFAEHWGFSLAYLRYLPLKESNIELYPYFKVSGFNLPYQTQNEVSGLRTEPAKWKFYSGIGLQIKCKLHRRIYLSASADAGARWEKFSYFQDDYFNGLAACGSVGLAYRIRE